MEFIGFIAAVQLYRGGILNVLPLKLLINMYIKSIQKREKGLYRNILIGKPRNSKSANNLFAGEKGVFGPCVMIWVVRVGFYVGSARERH